MKPGEAGEEGKKQVRRGRKAGRAEGLGGDSKARVGGGNGSWVSPVLLDRFPATVGGKGHTLDKVCHSSGEHQHIIYGLSEGGCTDSCACLCCAAATLIFMEVERKVEKPAI